MDVMDRFSQIYANNEWKHGSGEGSLEFNTRSYRAFLQGFLAQRRIRSVVDAGCGDWQFSRLMDWRGVQYRGFDVVPAVIAANARYAAPGRDFTLYSGDPQELPSADLLIVKDVLQHLPDEHIHRFLAILPRYTWALLTNCINPRGETRNGDIAAGEARYLDLRLPPFNLDATVVHTFERHETHWLHKIKRAVRGYPSWRKTVLLVDNSQQHAATNGAG